jgi:mono/diheme cytochrome c family protein
MLGKQTIGGSAKVAGAVGVAILLSLSGAPAHASDISRGEALVRANCSTCHAIGLASASPHREAPPFRELSERYPIDSLAEAFAEGISTGHPDMPEFLADPDQIDAIIAFIAFIRSLQSR